MSNKPSWFITKSKLLFDETEKSTLLHNLRSTQKESQLIVAYSDTIYAWSKLFQVVSCLYLNLCCLAVDLTNRNKLKWNFSRTLQWNMMMSSNGNIFRVPGLLCGEFTGHRWIPLTKASDADLWRFLWSAPETTVEQTGETPLIWVAITLNMTSL